MKAQRLGILPVILALPFLLGAGPKNYSVFSPRVIQMETALHEYLESNGRKPLAVPVDFQPVIRNLPADGVAKPNAEPALHLLVVTDQPTALRDAGIEVGTVAGRVATVTVPLSRLPELQTMPGVLRVELSKPLTPLLDKSRVDVNADDVHVEAQPPYTGHTGSGVVVGIVDTGIYYQHDDFIEEGTGDNRITGIRDQIAGVTWTATQIDNGIASQKDLDGHGTHVSGIAVGNGRGGSPGDKYTFTGIAPEAEIKFVKTDFFENSIINAVSWIQSQAGPKPCVVNLSLGSQFGPHDGTGPLELALNGMSGPGRIIVAAAGNEGGQALHAEAQVPGNGSVDIDFRIGAYSPQGGNNNDFVYFDGWFEDVDMDVSVTTPGAIPVLIGPVGPSDNTLQITSHGTVRIAQSFYAVNGDRSVEIDLTDSDGTAPRSGDWTVTVTNNTPVPQEFDIWISFNRLGTSFVPVTWQNFVDSAELVSSPATADSVIAVGAYISKVSWSKAPSGGCYYGPFAEQNIAPFSSPGPRRDDVEKPEISAPGMGIGSALSADATSPLFVESPGNCISTISAVHVVSQGTSQAAPHVTGALALLLEENPNLSAGEAQMLLKNTARQDLLTGFSFSPLFGFGRLDVQNAMATITPVRLLSIGAVWVDDRATIEWTLTETEPGARFTVERGSTEDGLFAVVSPSLDGDLEFAWTDPSPSPDEPWYRVSAFARDGSVERFGPVMLEPRAGRVHLWQNAPNPFAASTLIAFELDRAQKVQLDVIDVSGRMVATLVADNMPSGRHEVEWDGTDSGGRTAAAGLYFYRIQTTDRMISRRMLLVR